eukprot:m.47714 g.47714  ORF g.47714 m.47714 type:complete len:138 (+) comp7352_c0_seq3:335-748(+)
MKCCCSSVESIFHASTALLSSVSFNPSLMFDIKAIFSAKYFKRFEGNGHTPPNKRKLISIYLPIPIPIPQPTPNCLKFVETYTAKCSNFNTCNWTCTLVHFLNSISLFISLPPFFRHNTKILFVLFSSLHISLKQLR